MKQLLVYAILLILIGTGCNHTPTNQPALIIEQEPIVKENGTIIEFPANSKKLQLFKSAIVENIKCMLNFSAPATVIGKATKSNGADRHLMILFSTTELSNVYATYLQNQTLLKTSNINFNRTTELYKNGAATGKELNDATSELLNLKNAITGNEAQFREVGLNLESLNNAHIGTVWLICDLPESELTLIKKGQHYELEFPGFPDEKFEAKIDVIADVLNSETRKIRVRLSLDDKSDKIRPGMYAKVKLEVSHHGLMIPKKALISANAKYYVYLQKSTNEFERREVTISTENGDYIEIASGIQKNEKIIISNVYLLKGINMGI